MRLKKVLILYFIYSLLCSCGSNINESSIENELYRLHVKVRNTKSLNDLKEFKSRYDTLLKNNQDHLFYYYFIEANCFFNLGDYDTSKKIYQKVLTYFKNKDEHEILYNSNRNLGYVYYEEGNYAQALKHYLIAYNITLKPEEKGFAALDIAEFYNELALKEEALQFLKNAENHFLLSNKKDNLKYVELGYYVLKESKFSNVQSVNSIINFLNTEKDFENLTFALLEKSKRFIELKKLDSAKWYANKSLAIATKEKMNIYSYLSKLHIARIYITNKDYTLAKNTLSELEKNIRNTNLNSYLLSVYANFADVYSKEKDWQNANLYFRKKDSVFELSKQTITLKSLADIGLKNNIKRKNISLKKATTTKNRLLLLLIILFFLFTIITQWVTNRNKRKQLIVKNKLIQEQQINKVRSEILANISHEIRTPLTLVIGNIQMALSEKKSLKKVHEYIEKALINSRKVVDDANEILDLLKFEKHKIKIHNTKFSLHNFCRRVVLSFDSLAKVKNLQLIFFSSISPDIYIESDEKKIEKIINNLVSNAIKYSKANHKIEVFLSQENNNFLLKVQDFGLGIPYKEKDKVFERFYQAENSKNIGGFGIGLSLSKEFATLLKGDLSVDSNLGKGSTFLLKIPLNLVEPPVEIINTSTQQITSITEKKSTQKPNILIVEDNLEMNRFLVEILKTDYNCLTAFDGQEALEKLKTSKIDLITSDVMMPNVDGFNFKEELNALPNYKHIPFIFISAKSLEEDIIKGFKMGVQDYITKPFNKNQLLARVHNLIQNKKTREIWRVKNTELLTENRNSFDKELIDKIEKIVIKNITNEGFKIEDLASEVGYSQRQLTRYLKEFTGMSPVKFILEIRLQKAYSLLKNNVFPTIKEVKYEVGIASSPYFNKKFKERFGILPKEVT